MNNDSQGITLHLTFPPKTHGTAEPPLQTYFINLAGQVSRREILQHNFSQFAPPGYLLTRVEAVDSQEVIANQVPGGIKEVEKACYLSHCKALELACLTESHAYILEDDAHFGPSSFDLMNRAIQHLQEKGYRWDILYTQVMPVSPQQMVEVLRLRHECLRIGGFCVPSTQRMLLAGACSYVVNASTKHRLLALLKAQTPLETPVDAYYWGLARHGQIQAKTIFPLPSSVAAQAVTSQIQSPNKALASLLWNAWMRLSAIDRHLDEIEASLANLPLSDNPLQVPEQVHQWLEPIRPMMDPQETRITEKILSTMCLPDFDSLFLLVPSSESSPSESEQACEIILQP